MAAAGTCPETSTPLTPAEALLVIEPYYLVLRDEFFLPRFELVRRARLYCAPGIHDSPRHFAATRDDGRVIIVAPEMAELSYELMTGILAHELGHACDFLYPAQFALGKDRNVVIRDRRRADTRQWSQWTRAWEKRDADVVEMTADAIAEDVMQAPIGYVGPCLVQAFNRGEARPQGLR